jgi:hypothetical protein
MHGPAKNTLAHSRWWSGPLLDDYEEEGGEEEMQESDAAMDVDQAERLPEPSVLQETFELPGARPEPTKDDERGPIPPIGVDWNNITEIRKYLPRRRAEQSNRVREVQIFEESMLKEYCKVHLLELYPGQPETRKVHGFSVFKELVVKSIWIVLDPFVNSCLCV